MNYTHSPWNIDNNGIITGGAYLCTSIGSVCTWRDKNDAKSYNARAKAGHVVLQGYQGGLAEDAQGNARLIEASPELFECLQNLIKLVEDEVLICHTSKDNCRYWKIHPPILERKLAIAKNVIKKITTTD